MSSIQTHKTEGRRRGRRCRREGGRGCRAALPRAVLALGELPRQLACCPGISHPLGLWASGTGLMAQQCCLFLGATGDLQGTVAPES